MKHIYKTNDAIYITSDEQPYIVEVCENKIEEIKKPKQETTLEEVAERLYPVIETNDYMDWYDKNYDIRNSFIKGAKWQQERSYSEEDMRNAFDSAREFNSLDGVVDVHIVLPMGGDMSDLQPLHFTFDDWFEQFKKK